MTNNDKNNNNDKSKQYKTLITEYWGKDTEGNRDLLRKPPSRRALKSICPASSK